MGAVVSLFKLPFCRAVMYAAVPYVPVCPPTGSTPVLSLFLQRKGFPGDEGELEATVHWLAALDVTEPCDFVGLGSIRSLSHADDRSNQVLPIGVCYVASALMALDVMTGSGLP